MGSSAEPFSLNRCSRNPPLSSQRVTTEADYRRLGSRSNSGLDQRAHARGLFPRLPRALLRDAHYSCAKAAIALATEAKGPTLPSGSSGACSRRRHHRGDHHTPPGRSPELASEKCTCTTRQPPASLRNTMVERVMNSSPP